MRTITTFQSKVALAIAAAVVCAVGVTWAANPHFIGKVTATLVDCDHVVVSWKEAGLGNNLNIDYEVTADATAVVHCVNGGGQCPNADNKMEVSGPVSATGTFNSGQNGQITASLNLFPPPVQSFCPSGQTETVTEVSFSNITITDLTNHVSKTATPSTLSATCFVCP